jgi:hypothetical protein
LAGAGVRAAEEQYGKHLVAQYQIPPETIEKYASFEPSAPLKHESKVHNVLLAKSEEWSAPWLDVKWNANPYVIVVTLAGTAQADGDAVTMWQAGWRLDDRETRMWAFPGLTRLGLKAGEPFTVTAVAPPVSFKEDRSVAVALGLVNARNVDIKSVDVAVWSGIPGASWLDYLGAFNYLAVALIFGGLIWYFRRRRA